MRRLSTAPAEKERAGLRRSGQDLVRSFRHGVECK